MHAQPSELSNSITIEHSDINIDKFLQSKLSHIEYKDSLNTFKNKETAEETRKQRENSQYIV